MFSAAVTTRISDFQGWSVVVGVVFFKARNEPIITENETDFAALIMVM